MRNRFLGPSDEVNESRNIAEFCRITWNTKTESLAEFNARFNVLYSAVRETNTTFDFNMVRDTWIRALPPVFSDLQNKYNKNQLDDDWLNATNIADLYVTTMVEKTNCNISLDNPKQKDKPTDTVQERKPPTLADIRKVKSVDRNDFPTDFPTATKVEEKIRGMITEGKTKADIETLFKADYPYAGCYCCRIKQ